MRSAAVLLPCLLVALAAQAQTNPPAATPGTVAVRREYVGSSTPPEPRAERETDLLAGQLGLSPAQRSQVYAAALTQMQAHQAMLRKYEAMHYVGTVPPAEVQAIEEQFEARLRAICIPEQYQKRQLVQARFRRLRARYDSLQRAQPGGGGR